MSHQRDVEATRLPRLLDLDGRPLAPPVPPTGGPWRLVGMLRLAGEQEYGAVFYWQEEP